MKHLLFLITLTISAPLLAQNLGDIALLVFEPDQPKATVQLQRALRSEDPALRTAAARVSGVTKLVALLPLLKEAAAKEDNAEAAREELRAIILLGGEKELDEALAVSQRFDSRLDAAIATTLARTGVSPTLLFTRLKTLSSGGDFLRIALWHRPQLLTPVIARVLGQGDTRLWINLLQLLNESDIDLDPALAAAALGHSSPALRSYTVWHLVDQIMRDKSAVPPLVLQRLDHSDEETRVDVAFGEEILQRLSGREAVSRPEWLAWLRSAESKEFLGHRSPEESLTKAEFKAFQTGWKQMPPARDPTFEPLKVADPQFLIPSTLPKGLGKAVMDKLRCRSQWLGVGGAAIDSAGRVSKTDLSGVSTTGPCKKALEAFLRLSLATNTSLHSTLVSKNVVLVRAARAPVCLDESDVAPLSAMHNAGDPSRSVEDVVKAPRVKRRIEPVFPKSTPGTLPKGSLVTVIAQAVISETGCVRNPILITQSRYPTINSSALLAVTEWTFEPGTLNGENVSVVFQLTVSFRK